MFLGVSLGWDGKSPFVCSYEYRCRFCDGERQVPSSYCLERFPRVSWGFFEVGMQEDRLGSIYIRGNWGGLE